MSNRNINKYTAIVVNYFSDEPLPMGWQDMTDETITKFIEDNITEGYEDVPIHVIMETIGALAYRMTRECIDSADMAIQSISKALNN